MTASALGIAVAAVASVALVSCGTPAATSATTPSPQATAAITTPEPTAPPVSAHDVAVALRKVTSEASSGLASASSDLQQAATLDQASQTLPADQSVFDSLHTTIDQLPSFPVAKIQQDVQQMDTDLGSLSSLISATTGAEVYQYPQYKQQLTALIATTSRAVGVVNADLTPY